MNLTRLQSNLLRAGITVSLERIRLWSRADQQEAKTWAHWEILSSWDETAIVPPLPACLREVGR